jgi:hypothetical protein
VSHVGGELGEPQLPEFDLEGIGDLGEDVQLRRVAAV